MLLWGAGGFGPEHLDPLNKHGPLSLAPGVLTVLKHLRKPDGLCRTRAASSSHVDGTGVSGSGGGQGSSFQLSPGGAASFLAGAGERGLSEAVHSTQAGPGARGVPENKCPSTGSGSSWVLLLFGLLFLSALFCLLLRRKDKEPTLPSQDGGSCVCAVRALFTCSAFLP